jgi:phosphoribosylformimino-5-aminoimidazole carboxamide ribotide isomerase
MRGAAPRGKVVAIVILYPAIDLKDGACVRLAQGDMERVTRYNPDPAAQARHFREQGFRWLHVVDLDGAVAGKPVNRAAVEAIMKATDVQVQLGGGIRSLEAVDAALELGVARVILGTIAVRDPALVTEACRLYPGHIAVGIDARGTKVAVQGWSETSEINVLDLARRFEDAGVSAIIYTDIERDGLLGGVNVEATAALARAVRLPVIASGGVAGIADIEALMAVPKPGIAGVICGRALYDGRLDAERALALAAG